ncbi:MULTISPECIES: DUF6682 family protein [Halorhodospira]|uniref:phage adaptor protein n=1 Tax=Halorhodospira TaxID=85108 RepID=UPI0019122001|nr:MULTISPECIES: DUF6682 family protein [Halorhodospira]MBK5943321.1 hypothetical protein [Halorhodospira halophila]MCG5526846.1 hypothetical protein [Halorhodospira halophila]MCG5542817.1 hypothetical protein [Halorhodospira sp. 9628]
MPTVTAKMILDRASSTLNDEAGVRWGSADLLTYVSDAQREIVILKPSANALNDVVALTPGTRQRLPQGGITLIDVVRNMGGDGNTPGRAVRPVRRAILDATRPDWHTEPPSAEVKHFVFDERDPKTFYVTPGQPDPAGHLEIVYSASPAEVESLESPITLDDVFQTPIYYYVMSRAHAKSSTPRPQLATLYYEQFVTAVTGRIEAQRDMHQVRAHQRVEEGIGHA